MSVVPPAAAEALARVVVEDAEAERLRLEDRARNEARRIVLEAEDAVAELSRAALELGRTRGQAADAALAREADAEVEAVRARSFEALRERFTTRVRMALEALGGSPASYAAALSAWARHPALRAGAPLEVHAAAADRPAIYAAFLEAGVRDFRVGADPRVATGFVARDPDGRTLLDATPPGLVEAAREALESILVRHLEASREPGAAPGARAP